MRVEDKIKYKTYFGDCPSKAAGSLTLNLVKSFEKNKSLRELKLKIKKERLYQKHFLKNYSIKFNPIENLLSFKFECPRPLMKTQIYKKNGIDSYEAILVDTGELFDPTYEVLLRSENKLNFDLPSLALPVNNIDSSIQKEITQLIKSRDVEFRKKLSEIIVDEQKELTVILSVNGNPSSAFFGRGKWSEKLAKLQKIVSYMEKKRKFPAIINLTNSNKVVVKFNDKF